MQRQYFSEWLLAIKNGLAGSFTFRQKGTNVGDVAQLSLQSNEGNDGIRSRIKAGLSNSSGGFLSIETTNPSGDSVEAFKIDADQKVYFPVDNAPASLSAPGIKGQMGFDENYIYRCVDTNTWKRFASVGYTEPEIIYDGLEQMEDVLPLKKIYNNTFASDSTGVSAFNGGTLALSSGRLQINASSSGRGVSLDVNIIGGKQYLLVINVYDLNGVSGIRLDAPWPSSFATITTTGRHEVYFTCGGTISNNYNAILTLTQSGTAYVEDIYFYEVEQNQLIPLKKDTDIVSEKMDIVEDDLYSKEDVLPIEKLYSNDFSANTTGITAFNSGTFVLNTGRLDVTTSSSGRGITLDVDLIGGQEYILYINVYSLGSTTISLTTVWPTVLKTITTTGLQEVKFTCGGTVGSIQQVTLSLNAADTISIEKLFVYHINSERLLPTNSDMNLLLANKISYLLKNDFNENYTGITAYNGGLTLETSNSRLKHISTGTQFVFIGDDTNYRHNEWVVLNIDITIGTSPIQIKSSWSTTFNTYTITSSGIYSIPMRPRSAGDALQGIALVHTTASVGTPSTIYLNNIEVFKGQYQPNLDIDVMYGNGAYVTPGINGTAIGNSSSVTTSSGVANGVGAVCVSDTVFGCADGLEAVAIGQLAKSFGWRAGAFGAKAQAAGQSSTAVGTGTEVMVSHGVGVGRGITLYGRPQWNAAVVGGVGCLDFYLGNGWGHRFYACSLSGIDVGGYHAASFGLPSTQTSRYHGIDAFDARPRAWDSGTSFNQYEFVKAYNRLYVSKNDGNVNHDPVALTSAGMSDTYWTCIVTSYTADVSSDVNIAGGNVAVSGGRGTGTGIGGEVVFETAPSSGSSNNTKNTLVAAGKFDASVGVDTRFVLLDVVSGTMKRVKFDTVTAPGKKLLYVDA